MVKHIVFWRLKDFAEGQGKVENAAKIKSELEALKNKISQIKSIEVGININKSDSAYDVALYSEFENTGDLSIYQNHPDHLKIAEFVKNVVTQRAVADYEV